MKLSESIHRGDSIKIPELKIMRYAAHIPFISILITGRKLASEAYSDCDPAYLRKQQLKIFLYVILHPFFAGKWFNLFTSAKFNVIALNRPRLYVKPFRPYISVKWNRKRKIKVILDTYRFMENREGVFRQFLIQKEAVIAKLNLADQYEGIIKLNYNDGIRNEGELALSFECDQFGGKITTVVFSLEEIANGKWVGFIGCVQGHKHENVQNSFKIVQKLVFGMRPNSLIIYTVQEFLKNAGCTAIYCTSNSIHVSRQKHAINFPWERNITFDYDQFWYETGGKKINKDWFEIPLTPIRKHAEEIKSHKRSMYTKRYEMLDNLSLEIFNSVKTSH